MPRWFFIAHLVLLAALAQGCVYYNKFYNAKKRFKEAHHQRLLSEADPDNRVLTNAYLDYYLSAIRKASIVLDLHPNSKWVDDSLLLIGQSYYWRGEHREARVKFNELLDNFPDSDLRTEALYWKGLSLWGNDDISAAREILSFVSESENRFFAAQSILALADLEQSQGNHDDAKRTYLGLVDKIKDDELETRLWKGLGDTYFAKSELKNALNAYRKVLQSKPDDVTSYSTQIRIGAVLELSDDLEEALSTYKRLERSKRFRLYQPKVQLLIANLYRLRGDIDGALEAYSEIIKRNPRTETSAEAYYQIALIEHQVRRNNEKALELFATARKERHTSDVAVKAREMETTLFQLDKFKKRGEKKTKRGTAALFNVAEIYLFSLGEVDSALTTYERVLTRADSSSVPKALYGMGLIYADSLRNEEKATELFERLVQDYPITPYAVDARLRIGADRSDDVLAAARYLEAEALKAEGASPQDVITILRQVTEEYPNSLYAPKALFALGWAYENDLGDLETANTHYMRLTDDYPMTEFAEVSADKLKQIKKELRDRNTKRKPKPKAKTPKKKDPPPPTADAAFAEELPKPKPTKPEPQINAVPIRKAPRADGPLEASEVEQLPLLVHAPPSPAAEEIGEEDVSPSVMVRFLVGIDGRVKKVVVVEGADVLQEQAVDVAFQYLFEPGIHKGKPCEVWMEFPITFLSPEQGGSEPE